MFVNLKLWVEFTVYIAVIGKNLNLVSKQSISFNRMTFVDKLYTERVTIDTDLQFFNQFESGGFENIVIAEVKKDRSNNSSKFTRIAKGQYISPTRCASRQILYLC